MELLYNKLIHNDTYFYESVKNIMCCESCKKNNNFKHYPIPTVCYMCSNQFSSKSQFYHHRCNF